MVYIGVVMTREPERLLEELLAQGLVSPEDVATARARLQLRGADASPPALLQELESSGKLPQELVERWETLSAAPTEPADLSSEEEKRAFSLPERFVHVQALGSGGMGTVFKAFDTVLQRWVAIKVLRKPVANLQAILTEARAQAQVDHPNVCPIYEVSEAGEAPFIVMRYVPGTSLLQLCGQLKPTHVAKIGAQLAGALHAAHERQLLHRDVKPGNVLVENLGGELRASLLDFGLSQEAREVIAGTPAFMAPELLQGSPPSASSDVFSLGATLYTALAGQPPLQGSWSEVLAAFQNPHWQPPPLPASVPEDLALIIRKTLSVDPQARYPSAQALGEDLERFLAGQPVAAHPPSRWYVVRKHLTRHRASYLVAALALVAVVGSVGSALWYWRMGKVQASLRSTLLTSVMGIESQWRAALTREAQDLSQVRKGLLANLEESVQLARQKGLEESSLLLLQGRAFLALGEHRQARQALERAHAMGLKSPELRQVLGLALLQQWQEEQELARRIPNRELRQAREAEIRRSLREPARELLRSLSLEPSAHLLAAKLAFLEGNYQEALRQGEAARAVAPWRYEGEQVLADASLAQTRDFMDQGHYAQASKALEKTLEHYGRACLLAPSLAAALLGQANAYLEAANLAVETGKPPQPWWDKAKEAAEKAARVDPENRQAWESLALLALRQMDFAARRGESPEGAFAQLDRALSPLLAQNPNDARALGFKGIGLRLLALGAKSPQNAQSFNAQALSYLAQALQLDPTNTLVANNLGLIHLEVGLNSLREGQDPLPNLEPAVNAFSKLLQHAPENQAALDNLGATQWVMASVQLWRGEDFSHHLVQAEETLSKARARNPQDVVALSNLALCAMLRGTYKLWQDQDPLAELQAAQELLQATKTRNPQEPTLLPNSLRWHWIKLRRAGQRGEDPRPLLAQAQNLVQNTRQLANDSEALGLWAGIHLAAAGASSGKSSSKLWRQASQALGEALRQAPHDPELLFLAGQLAYCSHGRFLPAGLSLAEVRQRLQNLPRFPLHQTLATLLKGENLPLAELPPGLKRELAQCR